MACACVVPDGWAKIAAASSSRQARKHQRQRQLVVMVPTVLAAVVVDAVLVVLVEEQVLPVWAELGMLPLEMLPLVQKEQVGSSVKVARNLCWPQTWAELFAESEGSALAMENATPSLPSVSVHPTSSELCVRCSVVLGFPKLGTIAQAMAFVKWASANALQGGAWFQVH